MRFYSDKDTYVHSESLSEIQKKKDKYNRIISALMVCEIFCCAMSIKTSVKYKIDHTNPFVESKIVSGDLCVNYKIAKSKSFLEDESFKDIIASIKNSDISEKKAYLLYYSLISNENLTEKDKRKLSGFLQYFIDNKYLDDEYVYNKLNTIKRTKNDPNMDKNVVGYYTLEHNSITLKSDDKYDYTFSHEVFHGEEKSTEKLNYSNYSWFAEGMTTVLNYEYNDVTGSYNIQSCFIRILCEILGSDALFKTRAKGDMSIIVDGLIDKGLNKNEIYDMFEMINKATVESEEELDYDSLKIEIIDNLRNWYLKTHVEYEYVKPMFYQNILQIFRNFSDANKKYYFNSTKSKEIPTLTQNVFLHGSLDHEEKEAINEKKYFDYYILNTIIVDGKILKTYKQYLTKSDFNYSIDNIIIEIEQHQNQNKKIKL